MLLGRGSHGRGESLPWGTLRRLRGCVRLGDPGLFGQRLQRSVVERLVVHTEHRLHVDAPLPHLLLFRLARYPTLFLIQVLLQGFLVLLRQLGDHLPQAVREGFAEATILAQELEELIGVAFPEKALD